MDVPIACPCPPRADGTPRHPEGDTVVLRERLDFRSAVTIRKAIAIAGEEGITDPAEILAVMTEWYCVLGIEAWTLADDRGKAIPSSRENVRTRLLDNPEAFASVADLADAADGLYMEQVLLPLVARASKSSPPMPTAASTSAPTASKEKRPKPSRPSSTTSSPTAAIVTTSGSPAGVSSISPRSESAA